MSDTTTTEHQWPIIGVSCRLCRASILGSARPWNEWERIRRDHEATCYARTPAEGTP